MPIKQLIFLILICGREFCTVRFCVFCSVSVDTKKRKSKQVLLVFFCWVKDGRKRWQTENDLCGKGGKCQRRISLSLSTSLSLSLSSCCCSRVSVRNDMCKWRATVIVHRSFLMRVINKNARMRCAYLSRVIVSVQQFCHFHGTAAKSFVFSLFLVSSDEVSFCMWTMTDCILFPSKQYTTDLWRKGKRFDFAAIFQSRLRVRYVSDESVCGVGTLIPSQHLSVEP